MRYEWPVGSGRQDMRRFGFIFALLAGCALSYGTATGQQQEQAGATLSTNADASAANLHLQEQIHATHLELERNRLEAEAAATKNAEMVASRLQGIEQSLSAQRARELEEIQRSNRLMLILTGVFAGVGLLALSGMAYFQWQTVSRLSALSGVSAGPLMLGPGRPLARLGPGESTYGGMDAVEQTNRRWSGILAQLEKRIGELEQTARPPLKDAPITAAESNGSPSNPSARPIEGNHVAEDGRVHTLVGKGQLLLNLGLPADALPVLDEALSLEPRHPEALVKKGTALEQLGRLEEAIECYDAAIAADGSLTMAYLCKGGLFSRMQRFQEALECYERALHTHTKSAG